MSAGAMVRESLSEAKRWGKYWATSRARSVTQRQHVARVRMGPTVMIVIATEYSA
jgi:hypothetical protein